ncbi:MAG: hypothetical protein GY835_04530 [bacterium]|nr:hypothetical protein [bacterium]
MKRCTRCILPESYPGITYDSEGVCNICHTYTPVRYKGEAAFRELLADHPAQGKYDCLVPVSGGRDSSYVLLQLVKKYKLRVLVYNYDNGFVEKTARDNVERMAKKLGVDVIFRKSRSDVQKRTLKHYTRVFLGKTPGHVATNACIGCSNGIWGGAYQVAKSERIPIICFGESEMESSRFKRLHEMTPFEKGMSALLKPINFLQRKLAYRELEREFPFKNRMKDIPEVNFFGYEEWNEANIEKAIREELDWEQKDGQSSWRFDCRIHALANRMTYNLLGFTEKDELYSKLIREGQIDRVEAMRRIEESHSRRDRELEIAAGVVRELELSETEQAKIMDFCRGPVKPDNAW